MEVPAYVYTPRQRSTITEAVILNGSTRVAEGPSHLSARTLYKHPLIFPTSGLSSTTTIDHQPLQHPSAFLLTSFSLNLVLHTPFVFIS